MITEQQRLCFATMQRVIGSCSDAVSNADDAHQKFCTLVRWADKHIDSENADRSPGRTWPKNEKGGRIGIGIHCSGSSAAGHRVARNKRFAG